jgi:hypothetical protein
LVAAPSAIHQSRECVTPRTQTVRLIEVALVGPAMIAGATALRRRVPWLAWSLGLLGVATVGYNAISYLRLRGVTCYDSRVTTPNAQ